MTQLETRVSNYQTLIDCIKNNKITSQKILAEKMDLSQTRVSQFIKSINRKKQHISFSEYYTVDIDNALDLEEIATMIMMINEFSKDPHIIYYQNKHLMGLYNLDYTEVMQFRAYIADMANQTERRNNKRR